MCNTERSFLLDINPTQCLDVTILPKLAENTYYSRRWSTTTQAKTREPSSHQLFQASKATHPHFQGQTGLWVQHSYMKICAQWRRSTETARNNRSETGGGEGKNEKVLSNVPGLRAAVKAGITTGWDLAKYADDSQFRCCATVVIYNGDKMKEVRRLRR